MFRVLLPLLLAVSDRARGPGSRRPGGDQFLGGIGKRVWWPATFSTAPGEDAVSVTGWLFLPTGASGTVFDFGQDADTWSFSGMTFERMPGAEDPPP